MKPALIEKLQLGRRPVVAGTIITADFLAQWSAHPQPLPCDIVELRLDGLPDYNSWLADAKKIEASGTPVFVTLRLANEGGKWDRPDEERLPALIYALDSLSGVDVELASPLAERVGAEARQRGKLCIISYHDFEKTPPHAELERILHRAGQIGSIGKIAARANSEQDVKTLRSLLGQSWTTPICIIGMGPFGRDTRLSFPREGSCLTYGYLDVAGAPGQYSATELRDFFQTGRKA